MFCIFLYKIIYIADDDQDHEEIKCIFIFIFSLNFNRWKKAAAGRGPREEKKYRTIAMDVCPFIFN